LILLASSVLAISLPRQERAHDREGNAIRMLIRLATPDDAWPIAAVDVAGWQAAYRGLMPDDYQDGLSIA
jgi:hypothetical protein